MKMNNIILIAIALLFIFNINNISIILEGNQVTNVSLVPLITLIFFVIILDKIEYPKISFFFKLATTVITLIIIYFKIYTT
jgi:hypothetical protein